MRPVPVARRLSPEAVSGRGTVYSVTVNHHPWYPGQEVPSAVALVDLEEQAGLRLTTNVTGCAPQEVHIGASVRATFTEVEDVWIPTFEVLDPHVAHAERGRTVRGGT